MISFKTLIVASFATFLTIFFTIFLAIFLAGCGEKTKADFDNDLPHCPQKPSAIFQNGMNGVKNANFELQATKSVENVVFNDDSHLEIIQMGCAHINQEFRFEIAENAGKNVDNRDAAKVAEMAAEKFAKLAKLDPKLAGLGEWSGMLLSVKDALKIGEPMALEPHHFLKIDCFSQDKNTLLIVNIFEE